VRKLEQKACKQQPSAKEIQELKQLNGKQELSSKRSHKVGHLDMYRSIAVFNFYCLKTEVVA
jgi:hypothetical protein